MGQARVDYTTFKAFFELCGGCVLVSGLIEMLEHQYVVTPEPCPRTTSIFSLKSVATPQFKGFEKM